MDPAKQQAIEGCGRCGQSEDAHAKTAAFCARHGYANQVDMSPDAMSCRILGLLLGAGWLPPGGLEIPEEMIL